VSIRPAPALDAALTSEAWIVGESYAVCDAIVDPSHPERAQWWEIGAPQRVWAGSRLVAETYLPAWDGTVIRKIVRDDRRLPPLHVWQRAIVDESPDPRTRSPHVWLPGGTPGLAEELAGLAAAAETTIVGWVEVHGFVGVRGDASARFETIEEIRTACARLAQARGILRAVRELRGDALRAEVERLTSLPSGILESAARDETINQPMAGTTLARAVGIEVPAGERWPDSGPFLQALYVLGSILTEPVERLLRVSPTLSPTPDGFRLQAAISGVGPLATAYLRTLEEASWPAIAYDGSVLRVNVLAPRRCPRCGTVFTPRRRDQKWCTPHCRWLAAQERPSSAPRPPARAS